MNLRKLRTFPKIHRRSLLFYFNNNFEIVFNCILEVPS